jgi:ligand-binding SRPBCC domain-containing protein
MSTLLENADSKTASGPEVVIDKVAGSSWRLTTQVMLPRPRREVFQFFSDAGNLEKITPQFLNFRIITPLPIEMRRGARIDYRIRLRGIPVRWRTNIAVWQPDERFVDEQIRGPYRRWHHEHIFEDHGDQTLMTDIVDYQVWLGFLLHPLMVRNDLIRIFEFRRRTIVDLFTDH